MIMPKGVETIALSAIAVLCIGSETGQLRPLGAAPYPVVIAPFEVIVSSHEDRRNYTVVKSCPLAYIAKGRLITRLLSTPSPDARAARG
jgi:hypothetical protein